MAKKEIMTKEEREVILRLSREVIKAAETFSHKIDVLNNATNDFKIEIEELLETDKEFIDIQKQMDMLSAKLGM